MNTCYACQKKFSPSETQMVELFGIGFKICLCDACKKKLERPRDQSEATRLKPRNNNSNTVKSDFTVKDFVKVYRAYIICYREPQPGEPSYEEFGTTKEIQTPLPFTGSSPEQVINALNEYKSTHPESVILAKHIKILESYETLDHNKW